MLIGMEKESLIFNKDFTPHNFNKKDLIKNMTLDFSDNQVEIVSTPHTNIQNLVKEMYDMLDDEILTNKYMWPMSQPGINNYIPSTIGGNLKEQEYRSLLAKKYNVDLMNISGIHFNFSMELEKNIDCTSYHFELMK